MKPRRFINDDNKFLRSGMYQLTCEDCSKKYAGQTGRNIKIMYVEHLLVFRNGYANSSFAQHILDHDHAFGKMEDTVGIMCFNKKHVHLNTLENFHIYEKKN